MRNSARVDRTAAARVVRVIASFEAAGVESAALTAAAKTEATIAGWLDGAKAAAEGAKAGNLTELTAQSLLAAAQAGEKRPASFTAAIETAEAQERVAELEARILTAAHDEAAIAVVDCVGEHLLENLRPAFQDVLGEVRKLAPTLKGVDPDDAEAVLRATTKTIASRGELLTLRRRFDAIRTAWAALVGAPTRDSEYGNLRHPERAYGAAWRGRRLAPSVRPWPTGPLSYLLWLSSCDAEPWLPSSADVAGREREAVDAAKAEQRGSRVTAF